MISDQPDPDGRLDGYRNLRDQGEEQVQALDMGHRDPLWRLEGEPGVTGPHRWELYLEPVTSVVCSDPAVNPPAAGGPRT